MHAEAPIWRRHSSEPASVEELQTLAAAGGATAMGIPPLSVQERMLSRRRNSDADRSSPQLSRWIELSNGLPWYMVRNLMHADRGSPWPRASPRPVSASGDVAQDDDSARDFGKTASEVTTADAVTDVDDGMSPRSPSSQCPFAFQEDRYALQRSMAQKEASISDFEGTVENLSQMIRCLQEELDRKQRCVPEEQELGRSSDDLEKPGVPEDHVACIHPAGARCTPRATSGWSYKSVDTVALMQKRCDGLLRQGAVSQCFLRWRRLAHERRCDRKVSTATLMQKHCESLLLQSLALQCFHGWHRYARERQREIQIAAAALVQKNCDDVFLQNAASQCFLRWRRIAHERQCEWKVQATQRELSSLCSVVVDVARDVADLGVVIEEVANGQTSGYSCEVWLASLSVKKEIEADELGYELPWLQQQCREWKSALSTRADTGEEDVGRRVRSHEPISCSNASGREAEQYCMNTFHLDADTEVPQVDLATTAPRPLLCTRPAPGGCFSFLGHKLHVLRACGLRG